MATSLSENRARCSTCSSDSQIELKRLPCGDVFCSDCLSRHHQKTYGRERVRTAKTPCPGAECRQRYVLLEPPIRLREADVFPEFASDRYPDVMRESRRLETPFGVQKKVFGMAVLEGTLYVTYHKCNTVYKFNTGNNSSIAKQIEGLTWPRGIAANSDNHSVYIIDWRKMFGGSMLRLHSDDHCSNPVPLERQPFGISVSKASKLIVTCSTPGLRFTSYVYIYKDELGVIKFESKFQLSGQFEVPRHTVQLDEHFITCYGWNRSLFSLGPWHRVSKVSTNGELFGSYGTTFGNELQQLACPLFLMVDEDGLILVVDYYNHRIVLLNRHLQLIRHLLTSENGLWYPRSVCFDTERKALFVGLESGNILEFMCQNS